MHVATVACDTGMPSFRNSPSILQTGEERSAWPGKAKLRGFADTRISACTSFWQGQQGVSLVRCFLSIP